MRLDGCLFPIRKAAKDVGAEQEPGAATSVIRRHHPGHRPPGRARGNNPILGGLADTMVVVRMHSATTGRLLQFDRRRSRNLATAMVEPRARAARSSQRCPCTPQANQRPSVPAGSER